jgi:hypothetical protein
VRARTRFDIIVGNCNSRYSVVGNVAKITLLFFWGKKYQFPKGGPGIKESISDLNISVADPGCLSWIPDPDFYPSRIPDLGSKKSN